MNKKQLKQYELDHKQALKKRNNIPFDLGVGIITGQEIEVPIWHLPSGQLLGTIKGRVKLAKPEKKKGRANEKTKTSRHQTH